MAYEVEFAGQPLSKYCKILSVERDILPERENFSKEIPSMHGSHFTGFKYKERVITLEVAIIAISNEDLREKVRKLAEVLDVKNPSRLIIGDEPNKYYYAIVDGSTTIERSFKTGVIKINFICHNPIAYSVLWETFMPDGKIFTLHNNGTTNTPPIIEVDFLNKASFFQATNHKGETVLVGRPKDSTKPNVAVTDVVINDNCQDSSTFTTLSPSLLDNDREAAGYFGVGNNGNGMVCTNYGGDTENKWNGTCFRRNLGSDVKDFEVSIDLLFSSLGKNYTVPPTPPTPPPPPTPENPNPPTTNTYGTYQVVNCGGLWINREANTKNPLYAMAPNTKIYPTEIKNNWYKHTHKNRFGTSYTGWSYGKYLKKISDKVVTREMDYKAPKSDFAEYEMGVLEIYGYDKNGGKLFKFSLKDVNEFYEYVEPEFFIGNKLVLDDGKKCPSPRKIDIKDDDGKVTEQREVESGVFGDFNDLDGRVVIKRESNGAGNFLWSCKLVKIKDGKIIRTLETNNVLTNASYPKGALNYIGVYIGKWSNKKYVDLVAVNNIKVRRLNFNVEQPINGNATLFNTGDHLQVDFASGLVSLNDVPFMEHLDIGSEFFEIPTGRSQIIYNTDDTSAKVLVGIQEKYL